MQDLKFNSLECILDISYRQSRVNQQMKNPLLTTHSCCSVLAPPTPTIPSMASSLVFLSLSLILLFVYFWLHWVFFIVIPQSSLVVLSRCYSLVVVCELLFGFSPFGEQALGTWASVVSAHELSSCGVRT